MSWVPLFAIIIEYELLKSQLLHESIKFKVMQKKLNLMTNSSNKLTTLPLVETSKQRVITKITQTD